MNLTQKMLDCVAFIGIRNKKDEFEPRATAFFVRITQDQHKFDHLVTAEHVVSMLMAANQDIWLRVNLQGGGGAEFPLPDPRVFRFHPNNETEPTDVAVAPFGGGLEDYETGERVEPDYTAIALDGKGSWLPTPEFERHSMGLGAQIAIVGLFRSHYGRNRNIPVVRVGSIAARPTEPIFTEYTGYIDAYLIEARSIAGLSGSPVFALMDQTAMLTLAVDAILKRSDERNNPSQKAALVGLMHGHFDVKNINQDVVSEDAASSPRGIHTGMGIVVPVQKILETVMHPELVEMRKKIIDELRRTKGATPDLATDDWDGAPRSNDANPKHREDFTRLLNAAAKKPPQED